MADDAAAPHAPADVNELRRRLDMAEDELTFLKAVFEEYKDSSGELEAELDAQLKDLERSNIALKRENEQIRAQLQSTVTRSRKSAEEASNLTTALETHLEELTKREKKAQTRIRSVEQELEEAKAANGGDSNDDRNWVPGKEAEQLRLDKNAASLALEGLKEKVYDNRMAAYKVHQQTQSRFATELYDREAPKMNDEEDPTASIQLDLSDTLEDLQKTEELLAMTKMSYMLIKQVGSMLNGEDDVELKGGSEHAINGSCLVMLGKLMVLADSLPEFRSKIKGLKTEINALLSNDHDEDTKAKIAPDMATKVLAFCEQVTVSVFEPLQEHKVKQKEDEKRAEMEAMKADGMQMAEKVRAEAEAKMKEQMEAKLAELAKSSDAEMQAKLQEMSEASGSRAEELKAQAAAKAAELAEAKRKADEEMARLKQEAEETLASARSQAKAQAEKARADAIKETSADRKSVEEEIYAAVAAEMDTLRERLESSQGEAMQKARQQEMYQNSVKNAIVTQADVMRTAMTAASTELVELKRATQRELADTQKIMNESLNHVRKVARTIAKSDVATLSMMYERELDMRVKLQDQVQSLKGNIRVFCRIRPLLGKELENGETEAVKIIDEMTLRCEDPETGKENTFNFDRVFDPSASQEVVFDEMRTLCLSAMDGYNVCLFAYGITGSGKTFTVEGGEGMEGGPRGSEAKLAGLVYRTVKEIFRIAYGERGGAYETNIAVQILECYNEEFRDLMTPEKKTIQVKLVGKEVIVADVTKTPIKSGKEAMEVIQTGYGNRTVRGTSSNAVSSRSHSILTLHLESINLRTKKVYKGQLHFVDLAGSERVKKSEVTGAAFDEAAAINKSLSALGDVIQALSTKKDHVPFRNSQLTTLLKNSLGGNSKTVMISNIAPAAGSLTETVSSLQFATRVHKVEMGKATAGGDDAAPSSKAGDLKAKMAALDTKFKGRTANQAPLNSARGQRGKSPGRAGSMRK